MSKEFIANPLSDALRAIVCAEPPAAFTPPRTDDDWDKLQQWCIDHAIPEWSTGIGILEAAEHIVQEAIDNGNIYDPRSCEVCKHYRSASHGPCSANYGNCAFLAKPVMDSATCTRFKLAEEWEEE